MYFKIYIKSHSFVISTAQVVELADTQDSGSCESNISWGFKSPPGHFVINKDFTMGKE